MKLILKKKITAKTIIEGFPGVGLVGPITTEFLTNHLKFEYVGEIKVEKIAPVAPVHDGKLVKPISLYYNKQKSLLVIHSVSNITGLEWEMKDLILDLYKKLKAKKIISLEGVGNADAKRKDTPKTFIYTNNKKLLPKNVGNAQPLTEGIIMGVSGALMLNNDSFNHICLFVDANVSIPDSKASANLIKLLDLILDLKVDPKPLLKRAQEFETKLNNLSKQASIVNKISESKRLDYFG